MTDIQTEATTVVATAETEVKTFRAKVVAYVKAHVPTVVAAVAGYGVGATGVIGKVLKHFI